MKWAVRLFLLFALSLEWRLVGAQISAHPQEVIRIGGQDYIPVADWAAARNLDLHWLKREESLQLTNRSARLVLGIDHRETQINGIEVWLLFPLALRNGGAYMAKLDAQSTLQPLLSPSKNRPGVKIKRVCIDPGHGGKDPGNRVGSNEEKRYTLLLAQEVRKLLTRAGLKITMTRGTDAFVDLPTRPELARKKGADIFVSLHFNSADSGRDGVQGAEVYCLTPAGASSTNSRGEASNTGPCTGNRFDDRNLFLAYEVQKSLTRNLGTEDRGVRRARFAVLRDAVMPATLIEAGFMSHPVEGRKIFSSEYRQRLARAIVDGLLNYKNAVELAM